MAISEKIQLLGVGLYDGKIPDELTISSIPTASELDYVGGEDFDRVMLETILPQAVAETIDFKQLLEIDYHWLCRCLRILNYGPYHTTNAIFCSSCGSTSYGEYSVNLYTIECKPIPAGFVNDITIPAESFLDFEGSVHIKLPTIQMMLNAYKDKLFHDKAGRVNREFARICYMITSIGDRSALTPLEISILLKKQFSPADWVTLKASVNELGDYGLRAGGVCQCPKCLQPSAAFIALADDSFFRPTLQDLREWKNSRSTGAAQDLS